MFYQLIRNDVLDEENGKVSVKAHIRTGDISVWIQMLPESWNVQRFYFPS